MMRVRARSKRRRWLWSQVAGSRRFRVWSQGGARTTTSCTCPCCRMRPVARTAATEIIFISKHEIFFILFREIFLRYEIFSLLQELILLWQVEQWGWVSLMVGHCQDNVHSRGKYHGKCVEQMKLFLPSLWLWS